MWGSFVSTVQQPGGGPRPKNRRDLILRAAAELFRHHGYQAVGIDDIGHAVGITGPAVYRHFKNKEDVLMAALHRSLDRTIEAMRAAEEQAGSVTPEEGVTLAVGQLVATVMKDWDYAVVFRREARALGVERSAEIRPKRAAIVDHLNAAALRVHGRMEAIDLGLRMETQYGLLAGVLTYGSSSHRRRYEPFVTRLASGIVSHPDVPPLPPRTPGVLPPDRTPRVSRRETVLAAAAELFADRSFPAVGIDEVGLAAGITGPSVYRHFANKEAVLVECVRLLGDAVCVTLGQALALDAPPPAVLDELTRRVVDLAYDHPSLFVVYFNDGGRLAGADQAWYQQSLTLLFDEWEHAVRRARPDLTAFQARAVAYGVAGACTRVAASRTLRRYDTRPALHALLTHVQLGTPGA